MAGVVTEVQYGIGATCTATLDDRELEGLSARSLIGRVARTPQQSPPATRAARVLENVAGNRRTVDVELAGPESDAAAPPKPLELDDVVVEPKTPADRKPQKLTLRVSEPYVGG